MLRISRQLLRNILEMRCAVITREIINDHCCIRRKEQCVCPSTKFFLCKRLSNSQSWAQENLYRNLFGHFPDYWRRQTERRYESRRWKHRRILRRLLRLKCFQARMGRHGEYASRDNHSSCEHSDRPLRSPWLSPQYGEEHANVHCSVNRLNQCGRDWKRTSKAATTFNATTNMQTENQGEKTEQCRHGNPSASRCKNCEKSYCRFDCDCNHQDFQRIKVQLKNW